MSDTIRPHVGYVICTVQRSGSTWFAEVLGSTGELGRPSEYFSTDFQRRICGPTYPSSRRLQVERVLTDGVTPNGVYAFKIFPLQLEAVLRRVRWTETFPDLHFVYWSRRDVLGQALSWVRAVQTLQWRSTLTTRVEPAYDGPAIRNAIRWVVSNAARWEIYFARNGIEPLRFIYEDSLRDPQAAVDLVAAGLGLDTRPRVDIDSVSVAVQRDAVTDAWRHRFLEEFGDHDEIDVF